MWESLIIDVLLLLPAISGCDALAHWMILANQNEINSRETSRIHVCNEVA